MADRSRRLRIVFAGTPEFSACHLQYLIDHGHQIVSVYTQPDRPKGRGKSLQPSAVKKLALEHELPVFQPLSLKNSDAQRELAKQEPDLMIVVAYGLILPDAVLAIPRHGCINVHASLLPRWRGAAPIQRAILAGDSQSGVTIMQMDSGLDTGDILATRSFELDPGETAATLHDRLIEAGSPLLHSVIEQIDDGAIRPVAQNEDEATYASKLTSGEAAIDWSQPSIQIDRQVRAFNPVPGAWTVYKGERIKIWQTEVLAMPLSNLRAGRISDASDRGLDVETGSGVVRAKQLQLPGKRRMHIADLLRGNPGLFQAGDILGSTT